MWKIIPEPHRPQMAMAQAHCMLGTWGYTHTHTHTICNNHCFCTATVVAQTRLKVTLYYTACFVPICTVRAETHLKAQWNKVKIQKTTFTRNFLRSVREQFKHICRYTTSSLLLPIFDAVYFILPPPHSRWQPYFDVMLGLLSQRILRVTPAIL
jgi:hypothetical protein